MTSTEQPDGTTGDRDVDAAIASVADLGRRPLAEHPDVLEQAHTALRACLSGESR